LYPNPAHNLLYLKSNGNPSENLLYQIIDVNGRAIADGKLSNKSYEKEIRINSLPAGVYLLQISDSKEVIGQLRFVKM